MDVALKSGGGVFWSQDTQACRVREQAPDQVWSPDSPLPLCDPSKVSLILKEEASAVLMPVGLQLVCLIHVLMTLDMKIPQTSARELGWCEAKEH